MSPEDDDCCKGHGKAVYSCSAYFPSASFLAKFDLDKDGSGELQFTKNAALTSITCAPNRETQG
jgi:hypothetical protein